MTFRARTYCTYFDSCYLAQALVMLRSLRRYDPLAEINVLAFDDVCARVVGDIFGSAIRLIALETLHDGNPELRALSERSKWAFYATHKPALARFVLQTAAPGTVVTVIDADTCFFSDPSPVFTELASASIGLSPCRFCAAPPDLSIYGKFCAGFIFWRACGTAVQSVADWQADCVSWCSEEVQPDGRYMNQGYLSRWPERYAGVHVIRHPGTDLAYWNVGGYVLTRDRRGILVDGSPLIFYHYSGIHRDPGGQWYSYQPFRNEQLTFIRECIFGPYLAAVERERLALLRAYGVEGIGSVRAVTAGPEWVRI